MFYSNRSVAYTALERFEPALADADECVRLQPGCAKGHQRRAAAKFHLGDLQGAKAGYQATAVVMALVGSAPMAWAECALFRGRRGDVSICRICDHLHPDHAELGQAAWELEPANQKTKADLEHVLSEIAGMRVVLPERAG